MNYIACFFLSLFIILNLLRAVKVLFNPSFLNKRMFNTPTTKPYLFGYNLLLALIGILLLLAKLQVV